MLIMGNFTRPQRQELDETIFEVTGTDSNGHSERGKLTVKKSELQYVNGSRTREVVWKWQHIRNFAHNGVFFTFEVGRGHKEGEGSYGFCCINALALFNKVNSICVSQRSDLGQSVYNLSSHTSRKNPQQSGANIQPSSLPVTGLLLQSEPKTATNTALSKTYTDTSAHSGTKTTMENLDVFCSRSEVDKNVDQIEGPCTCTRCFNGSKAIMFCHDCGTSVCAECVKQHLHIPAFANHKLSAGLTKARSLKRRKSTGCLLSTDGKLNYANLSFTKPNGHSQQKESEGHNTRQKARTRSMTCTDGMLDGSRGKAEGEKLARNGAKKGDMLKIDYSRVDFVRTKALQTLTVERKEEQLLSTEERRAGFGNKYKDVTKLGKFK